MANSAPDTSQTFLASAARGTESLCRDELVALGHTEARTVPGGVLFDGTLRDGMHACLWSRIATRVQLRLTDVPVRDENDVYDAVRAVDLRPWFDPDHSIVVRAHANDPVVRNSHYLALKVKDAVCDSVRDTSGGRRPDVDKRDADVEIATHVIKGRFRLFLGLQGVTLNQRGYRTEQVEAPLRESLAAAVLAFSPWTPDAHIHDPMCGSGTLPIEAALMATDTAPGIDRSFGFESWPGFASWMADDWQQLQSEARDRRRPKAEHRIVGSDLDVQAIKISRANAKRAGVDHLIQFDQRAATTIRPLGEGAALVLNPPYGERVGDDLETSIALHRDLSKHIRSFDGHSVTLVSTRDALKQGMRMKPDARTRVYNGRIECELARYYIGRKHAVAAAGGA